LRRLTDGEIAMAAAAAAGVDGDSSVVQRRTVSKRPSLVLKPLSDCKDLPLLQRRASKGRPAAGLADTDAARLSSCRYGATDRVKCVHRAAYDVGVVVMYSVLGENLVSRRLAVSAKC